MKEYKYFLDTNIFLRAIVKDDLRAAKECENIFELLQENKFKAVTSTLVLAELVWTGLSFYKIQKEQIVDLKKSLKAEITAFNWLSGLRRFREFSTAPPCLGEFFVYGKI